MRRIVALLLIAACQSEPVDAPEPPITPIGPTETYGFVTTLGRDTVAAERITRADNALVIDNVDRWPVVRQRRTAMEIAPDGRLLRMVMDVQTPNAATPRERWRVVRARFSDDSVYVTVEDSTGITGRDFATEGALTVPHVSMLYGVIEFEIASAIRRAAREGRGVGDTLLFRQFYPDRDVGPRFVLHRGRVIPQGEGRVELRHDWLSGAGDATIDSAGRMLGYSGQRSTYKVVVTRTATPPDVATIAATLVAAELQAGPAQLSVRDTARGTIGTTALSVDYGRPLARGRALLGNVIEYDRVWRTGANEATHFTTSAPITLAGLDVPAGVYTLWTVPRRAGAELIVNRQTGQWGTQFDRSQNLGTVALQAEVLGDTVEQFTVRIEPDGATRGRLVLEWGTFRWTAPIVVR